MTTTIHSSLVIPAGTLNAASFLIDLRKRPALSAEEWDAIRDWLRTTRFDNGNFVAGEAALAVIRDLAPPDLRRPLVDSLAQSDLLPRLKALLPEVLQGPRAEQPSNAARTT